MEGLRAQVLGVASEYEGGNGCTTNNQSRAPGGFSLASALVSCGGWTLTTIHVVASYTPWVLSLDELLCLVMGRCPQDWNEWDAWWAAEHIWVRPDGGGGAWGLGIEPPTPPEVVIDSTLAPADPLAFCPIDEQADPQFDTLPSGPPIETCTSESCLRASPGVWLGSIPVTSALFSGFRHTATAVVKPDSSIRVTELMGWTLSAFNDVVSGDRPFMDDFSGYSWVKVGDAGYIGNAEASIANATKSYHGGLYTLSSNRFTSAVMKGAGILLRHRARVFVGNTPGLCSCGACSPLTP